MSYQRPTTPSGPVIALPQSPSDEVVRSNTDTTNPAPFEIVIPPIVWPEIDIPNPVEDVTKILVDAKPTITKWLWVGMGVATIALAFVIMGYAGISGEVRETLYKPAKDRIKNSVRGTK